MIFSYSSNEGDQEQNAKEKWKRKGVGFTNIVRLDADLAPKCRNESSGRRVESD